jgi:hypothetical protein
MNTWALLTKWRLIAFFDKFFEKKIFSENTIFGVFLDAEHDSDIHFVIFDRSYQDLPSFAMI